MRGRSLGMRPLTSLPRPLLLTVAILFAAATAAYTSFGYFKLVVSRSG